ncbi:pseudaminic acid cytidylyltransferase [Aureibacter tunicatorum]
MKRIAIIPARGGSKRIPRKNIKEFLGKPIIAYSIEAALESELFDEVMVSTDDDEIANVARAYGASIPFIRSKSASDDFATLADVAKEVLSQYNDNGEYFDWACCILPTAPFVSGDKLIRSFSILFDISADSLICVKKNSYPIQRSLIESNGFIELMFPENSKERSQDLEETYQDAGQFYWVKTNIFLEKGNRLSCGNTGKFVLPEMEVQDIDNYQDWELAELKFKVLSRRVVSYD